MTWDGAGRRCAAGVAIFVALTVLTGSARAAPSFPTSFSDWGGVGLLQTRTARFGPDSELSFSTSFVAPYNRFALTVQFLPGIEGTFRYTTSGDSRLTQLSGDQTFVDRSADLKFKLLDESRFLPAVAVGFQDLLGTGAFDSEYLVLSRRYYNLDFSLGMAWGYSGTRGQIRNPLIALSSHFKTRDSSFGGRGGLVEFKRFFTGERVGIFGGVEYLTPIDGLRLKAELDANDYTEEPTARAPFEVGTPINLALEYRPWPALSFSLGLERGNTLMARASLGTVLNEFLGVPKFEPPPPALEVRPSTYGPSAAGPPSPSAGPGTDSDLVNRLFGVFEAEGLRVEELDYLGGELRVVVDETPRALPPDFWRTLAYKAVSLFPIRAERITIASRQAGYDALRIAVAADDLYRAKSLGVAASAVETAPVVGAADPGASADALFDGVEAEGFEIDAVELTDYEITVYVSQGKYRQVPRAIGRVARIVANNAPESVEIITVVIIDAGVTTSRVSLLRKDLEKAVAFAGSPEELWQQASFESPDGIAGPAISNPDRYPAFDWSLAPKLRQHIGRPNNFFRFQIWMQLGAELTLARGWTVSGAVGRNIYNDFDKLDSRPTSSLPQVRSRIVEYLQQGENNLVNLATHYVFQPAQDWFARISAGYFEEMFAGFGGELLYRPYGSRWAIGFDINQVWQRQFRQRFGFLKGADRYNVVTGQLSTYYELPVYGLFAAVHAGRYLAGDLGATIEFARRFDSGVRIGAWATFTDVSAETFGEGSFDKGFFVSLPFDLFFAQSTRTVGTYAFRPLTRDGGQRLSIGKRLYGISQDGNLGELGRDWDRLLD